ncbi:MAG TPA: hypothetical protein VFR23_01115 [Jiangellaceae bacterium]|nr:hypothetical protein [Jiangellaceae bacterium]
MDLDTVIGVDIWPEVAGVIVVIIVALLSIRVAQHFHHKRRAEIEQKRVDRTKRIFFPW